MNPVCFLISVAAAAAQHVVPRAPRKRADERAGNAAVIKMKPVASHSAGLFRFDAAPAGHEALSWHAAFGLRYVTYQARASKAKARPVFLTEKPVVS